MPRTSRMGGGNRGCITTVSLSVVLCYVDSMTWFEHKVSESIMHYHSKQRLQQEIYIYLLDSTLCIVTGVQIDVHN